MHFHPLEKHVHLASESQACESRPENFLEWRSRHDDSASESRRELYAGSILKGSFTLMRIVCSYKGSSVLDVSAVEARRAVNSSVGARTAARRRSSTRRAYVFLVDPKPGTLICSAQTRTILSSHNSDFASTRCCVPRHHLRATDLARRGACTRSRRACDVDPSLD